MEIILQQLQSLPTLSSVATRLLALTADDESDLNEVVKIIESDPALTAKVLSLCRRADAASISRRVTTVERAVVMLGFDAIRNAALSIEIYNLFECIAEPREAGVGGWVGTPSGVGEGHHGVAVSSDQTQAGRWASSPTTPCRAGSPTSRRKPRFDAVGFWRHSIAVGAACELFASLGPRTPNTESRSPVPEEAFVCGLLHDLGKLALDRLLPRSYERVVELSEHHQANIAEMERRVIGLDHHTTGKRLAEQWNLPHILQDVMWLHGHPYETLPDLPHRRMIGLVTLGDLIARKQHIGFSGNHVHSERVADLCRRLDLDEDEVQHVGVRIHDLVRQRGEILGLDDVPTERLLLESIARANQSLGQINAILDRRTQIAGRQERILRAVSDFHQQASPGQSITAVCGNVVASAAREFGRGFYAVIYPSRHPTMPSGGGGWHIGQFSIDGRLLRSQPVEPPAAGFDMAMLADDLQVSLGVMGLLPTLSESLGECSDIRKIRLLPLRCGWGLSAVLIHDRPVEELGLSRTQLLALCETWASAIAAANQHEGARRLGEQLAESNRILTETQARLARTQAMAALGEMAAGAAHEMNNPLCIISGRSQVLAQRLRKTADRRMAEQIAEQAQRLSDLITSLHLFADPPKPQPKAVCLSDVIGRAGRTARERLAAGGSRPGVVHHIEVRLAAALPRVWVDEDQMVQALVELLVNAMEAGPRSGVQVQAAVEPPDDRLVIVIRDDGLGMNPRALAHAFDPFFSDKPAGRQPGLGLARAQRLVAAHGGTIELESQEGSGTTARITLTHWKAPEPSSLAA